MQPPISWKLSSVGRGQQCSTGTRDAPYLARRRPSTRPVGPAPAMMTLPFMDAVAWARSQLVHAFCGAWRTAHWTPPMGERAVLIIRAGSPLQTIHANKAIGATWDRWPPKQSALPSTLSIFAAANPGAHAAANAGGPQMAVSLLELKAAEHRSMGLVINKGVIRRW
jgi:hypothetical protein